MWWEFHRLMDLTPRSSSTRTIRSACSSRSSRSAREAGKQIWRYRFPAQEYDLGRAHGLRPGQQAGRPNDSPFKWDVGDVVAIDPREARSTFGAT
jgi:hypothetical protein